MGWVRFFAPNTDKRQTKTVTVTTETSNAISATSDRQV